ncbi:glycosyltransferase family 4 protein [Flavicella sediminum]|uniref:glycosyltransferase family 4 protein n=1 Tax=Flavicella sediminum TaxID=2585141 RepID=UPI0011208B51|nr:glycosyltransferase family 4 protein [Flavicella sediminum]
MKIFLPFEESKNLFIKEIQNFFNGTFSYGACTDYNTSYDIVNIHWPEGLFKWEEPTEVQLSTLESQLLFWKKHSKIVVVLHNAHPHYNDSKRFVQLYDLVLRNADGIIHLGNFSKNKYAARYKNANHIVIEHPLYTMLPNTVSRNEAREKLGISKKSKVILVFGALRSAEEEKMVLKAFQKLKLKDKILVIPRFYFNFLNQKNRYIKKIEKSFYEWNPKYLLQQQYVEDEEIQVYAKAADILLVVRRNNLNSGNIFLSWSFQRNVVAPAIANMGEEVENVGGSVYDPNDTKSMTKAILEAVHTNFSDLNLKKINEHHPKVIAEKYFNFFETVANAK